MFSIFHRALKSAILHRVAAANRTLTFAFRWEIFAIELSQRQLFIQKIQLQAQCFFFFYQMEISIFSSLYGASELAVRHETAPTGATSRFFYGHELVRWRFWNWPHCFQIDWTISSIFTRIRSGHFRDLNACQNRPFGGQSPAITVKMRGARMQSDAHSNPLLTGCKWQVQCDKWRKPVSR